MTTRILEFHLHGAHAAILAGVRIGNRVPVGGGAVVTRSVPDGVTLVNVIARIREISPEAFQ